MNDYSQYKDDVPVGANLMAALTDLADQYEAAELEAERLQKLMDEANANIRRIGETDIPKLMDGLEGTLKLPDGRTIKIAETIHCSIAGEKKAPAIKWLDDNGHSPIIKRRFTIEFGKADDKWAEKFERDLAKRKKPLNVKREKSVHPQTLQAFVREALGEGQDIPQDIFGVFRRRTAKITS